MFATTAIFTLYLLVGTTTSDTSSEATKIVSYDPGELLSRIFNQNVTVASRQRGYGLFFEDQPNHQSSPKEQGQYGLITFEDNNKRLKFEDGSQNFEDSSNPLRFENDGQNYEVLDKPVNFQESNQESDNNQVKFQDDNTINQNKRKKRRRRRKPKKVQSHQGSLAYPGVPGRPEFPGPVQGFEPNPYVNPGYPGPVPFKRRRRPRPSLATEALTAVTGALTSIALYDDYQCVPRLLCEAAGGSSLGSNGVLDSIAGIQPLLTLLSAYNGLSSSPLFVFGRAVFLGMTSKGNTGTCRYAYPQCPTDPEQLIHYLNNHNGGFFRFFNAPLPNQNLEQFYNHLGQNGQFNFEQGYGDPNLQHEQGNYGVYQNQQGYGFQNKRPSLYGNQNYGSNYAYDYNSYGNNIRFKNAEIQKRIQNKPVQDIDVNDNFDNFEDDDKTTWLFPDEPQNTYKDNADNSLKFPEESKKYDEQRDSKRKGNSILFPENKYNPNYYSNKMLNYYTDQDDYRVTRRPYYQNNYNNQRVINANVNKYTTTPPFNENDYYYDHKHNFYVKKDSNNLTNNNNYNKNINNNYHYNSQHNNYNNNQNQGYNNPKPVNYVNYNAYASSKVNNDGVQTVYVVRGNGDPSRPEIVKVRPGQTIH